MLQSHLQTMTKAGHGFTGLLVKRHDVVRIAVCCSAREELGRKIAPPFKPPAWHVLIVVHLVLY